MPILDRPSWEKFAKAVATGKTQGAAYKACGFKVKDVDSAASDLANNPKVKQRIRELTARVTDKAIERAALTKEWVLEGLRSNAEKALFRSRAVRPWPIERWNSSATILVCSRNRSRSYRGS